MYIVTPYSTIWGLCYSIYKKDWLWVSIFAFIGVVPWISFRFGPEWLFIAIFEPIAH